MKNKGIKIISFFIAFLTLIIYLTTYSLAELTDLQKQATDLNHDGKIDYKDIDLIVHQPVPERVIDGEDAPSDDVYYIFRESATFVEADDYIVDTSQSDKSLVITDKAKFEKAIKALYTGQAQDNLMEVLNDGSFMKIQEDYNVNAVFAIAVTTIESGCGTGWAAIPPETHNWISIQGNYNGSSVFTNREWRSYPSFGVATLDFGDLIANSAYYFQAGNYSVKQIAIPYCDATWGEAVVAQMNKIYEAMGISTKTKKSGGGSGNGDIMEAADKVHQDEITWCYYTDSTGLGGLYWNDIEKSLNNPNKVTCCATFVACVLYTAGLFTEEEMNKYNYNHCRGLYDLLKANGWQEINSYSELEAGDVVWERGIDEHVQLYAGSGTWYNAGWTGAIQQPAPYSSDDSGVFVCGMRKN